MGSTVTVPGWAGILLNTSPMGVGKAKGSWMQAQASLFTPRAFPSASDWPWPLQCWCENEQGVQRSFWLSQEYPSPPPAPICFWRGHPIPSLLRVAVTFTSLDLKFYDRCLDELSMLFYIKNFSFVFLSVLFLPWGGRRGQASVFTLSFSFQWRWEERVRLRSVPLHSMPTRARLWEASIHTCWCDKEEIHYLALNQAILQVSAGLGEKVAVSIKNRAGTFSTNAMSVSFFELVSKLIFSSAPTQFIGREEKSPSRWWIQKKVSL